MKISLCQTRFVSVLSFCVLNFSALGGTVEENQKFIAETLSTTSDVSASNLSFLELLAEGKTFEEASAGKRSDPDTLATYEALTPDARKKLAVNFVGKIKNAEALEELAEDIAGEGKGRKPTASEEDTRKAILAWLESEADVDAGNLLFLQGLAEGKSLEDASEGKSTDPATRETYQSLPADARKKLAANFIVKIKDAAILKELAEEMVGEVPSVNAPTAVDPKKARELLIRSITLLPDVGYSSPKAGAEALLYLKVLAEGKTMAEADAAEDPETLQTYESLTPDARKKLAVNFAAKITDGDILFQLALSYVEMSEEFVKEKEQAPAPPAGK